LNNASTALSTGSLEGKFQYFTQKEIENGKIIPDELYPNIIPTMLVLDYLREKIREPIYINSTYRDPDYNRAVGGAKDSLHLVFNAVDFTIRRESALLKMRDIKTIYRMLDNFDKNGLGEHSKVIMLKKNCFGLGLYLRGSKSFIHLDTRGLIGRKAPARWRG
jgi:hypothetical protein